MATDGYVTLSRNNGGTTTWLEQTHAVISAGTEYELKLVVTGSNPVRLEVWLNGVLKISYTDSSASRLTTGTPGIRCQQSGVKYNSFSAGTAQALAAVPGLWVEDTFPTPGTSMVGTAGLKWISEWGTITGDGVFASTSGTAMNYSMPVVNLGTNNYAVQADVRVPAASTWGGVYARASDPADGANNNYAAQLSTTRIELMRYNNYTYTWLASYNATFNTGTNYNVKLAVTGSNPVQLTVYLNGSPVITYNDSSASRITTGDVGIVTKGNSSGVKWDYFKVEAL